MKWSSVIIPSLHKENWYTDSKDKIVKKYTQIAVPGMSLYLAFI